MLWELFKSVDICPIYMDVMDEDDNSIPQSYTIIEEHSYDENFISGDGLSLVRRNSFNIRIFSRNISKAKQATEIYKQILLNNGIAFTLVGPVFNPTDKYYSMTFSGSYIYGR